MVHAERKSLELQGATFRPEITALARALCGEGDFQAMPAWKRLSQQKRTKTLERLQEMKHMQQLAEVRHMGWGGEGLGVSWGREKRTILLYTSPALIPSAFPSPCRPSQVEGCTFKPVMDGRSRAMMSDREAMLREMRMSGHEQLFQDAIRRQHKMEELASWVPDEFTFHPATNQDRTAQEYLRRSYTTTAATGSPAKDGVVDRLYACQEKVRDRLVVLVPGLHKNLGHRRRRDMSSSVLSAFL